MYKLIALDMDGTLLNSEKHVPQSAVDALRQAVADGKEVVFSTGRAIAELTEYLDVLPFVHYGVCESGALLYDFSRQEVIHQVTCDPAYVEDILKAASIEKPMIQVMSRGLSVVDEKDLTHMADFGMGIYQPMYERVTTPQADLYRFIREHITEIEKINLFHVSAMSREKTWQRLRHLPLDMALAEETSLEISPRGVTKGEGLSWLCDYLKVDLKETIAIGDADNDLDVLSRAGLSIAMGNANARVKSLSDVVVADHDHDGIAEAVYQYLLGR